MKLKLKEKKSRQRLSHYSQYIGLLLGFILCESLAASLFSLAVNPYGVMNTPTVQGFNHIKGEVNQQVRRFKAIEVTRIKPKALLLGSSRTEFGLDPDRLMLIRNLPAYNLGLPAANMYEVRRYLEHTIANQPNLKTVALGIDLFMFNEFTETPPDFLESRLEKNHLVMQDILAATFSMDASIGSLKTIKNSFNYSNTKVGFYYKNGMKNGKFYMQAIYGKQSTQTIISQGLKHGVFNDFRRKKIYQISPIFIEEFRKIIEICNENNIECKIFISPSHAIQWEAIRAVDSWSTFEEWKRRIVQITPVWDFSGYNSITTDPLKSEMKNYWDNSHYKKEVGDLVLNRIFGYEENRVPDDFGVWIAPKNIESHLEKIRGDRESWAAKNPDVVKFVEDLKP